MQLSHSQTTALNNMMAFTQDKDSKIFILKGYAGTGKTTLVKFYLEWLGKQDQKPILLASTGRAARLLANKTGQSANTVHGAIYQFNVIGSNDTDSEGNTEINENGQLTLNFGLRPTPSDEQKKVYIIDEASMLSSEHSQSGSIANFGSGNILSDLIDFTGNDKIVFVGDPAQLPPPVGRNPFSAALSEKYFQSINIAVDSYELTQVFRQKEGGNILKLATKIRKAAITGYNLNWEEELANRSNGIWSYYTQDLMLKSFIPLIKKDPAQTILITHSNKQAFFLNQNIRKALGQKWFSIEPGLLLLVVQNSYHVDLSNGDQVILKKVKFKEKRAGFTFLEIEVENVQNKIVHKTLLLKEFLFKEDASLPVKDNRRLLIDFDQRAKKLGLKTNSKDYKQKMMNDPYLNALRAKFGYAMTCHKSQGGEWPRVFLNLSKTIFMLDKESQYRWLYTAITRAQTTIELKPIFKGIPKRIK